ncbi:MULTISPECIES: substrate-binding periplasmic protein [Deefgea]|uniref:Transporter substrate-binding domain-containing protein n=1 Tax=Deefgea chitinilytica TaxID=570276 RepID=A0ABS2CB88_9NEIS|nr:MULTISPECIES: transporter substrate-binding domain-containing protein [Deefgea]MBM5570636.1 transporter substrate-binding domain-containing protein [Deefgea chitinilytica]MBM9887865.1 transporter substrate-binding domain-containing protein [Deefgea sp. CFH1-16]
MATLVRCLLLVFLLLPTAQAETITINAEDDWAPFSSISADKKTAVGLSVELVRAAYASQGIDVRFVPVPFARCLFEVEHGQVVACFNTSITDENREKFNWPSQPLLSEGLSILALSEFATKKISPKDLEGHLVGVTNGYTYPTWFMKNKKINKDLSRTDAVQLKKLLSRRIEYAVINTTPAQMMINADPAMRGKVKIVGEVEMSLLYLNFSKKHADAPRLLAAFETGFKAIQSNGVYARIQNDFKQRLGLLPQSDQ